MWLNFINSDSEEEFDMLKKLDDPVMNKAVRVIIDMSQDTQIREKARLREKALHDEAFYMEGARADEREKVLSEVMEDLKKYGMSDEEINKALRKR